MFFKPTSCRVAQTLGRSETASLLAQISALEWLCRLSVCLDILWSERRLSHACMESVGIGITRYHDVKVVQRAVPYLVVSVWMQSIFLWSSKKCLECWYIKVTTRNFLLVMKYSKFDTDASHLTCIAKWDHWGKGLEKTVLSFTMPLPNPLSQQKCYETLYGTQEEDIFL